MSAFTRALGRLVNRVFSGEDEYSAGPRDDSAFVPTPFVRSPFSTNIPCPVCGTVCTATMDKGTGVVVWLTRCDCAYWSIETGTDERPAMLQKLIDLVHSRHWRYEEYDEEYDD